MSVGSHEKRMEQANPSITNLRADVEKHLQKLTVAISDRSVASAGNQDASAYFHDVLWNLGWKVTEHDFDALDWEDGTAYVATGDGTHLGCSANPYSDGCDLETPMVVASTSKELGEVQATGSILLLIGDFVREPLLPKKFPFYQDPAQQAIIAAMEASKAAAIICASDGPPVIEDGDFEIPSVSVSIDAGRTLVAHAGKKIRLCSACFRKPSKAKNVIGFINPKAPKRIVVTAHIDAKKGVPGALDNATGITMLLLIARLMADYKGPYGIELVALNGEDHYAVPGQLAYLKANPNLAESCALNINIDGIGYKEGDTAFSYFGLSQSMHDIAKAELSSKPGACEGIKWPQGDHSMFVQLGCPAIAVTSNWLLENMMTQSVTHSEEDRIDLVEVDRLVLNAQQLKAFIEAITPEQSLAISE